VIDIKTYLGLASVLGRRALVQVLKELGAVDGKDPYDQYAAACAADQSLSALAGIGMYILALARRRSRRPG
jgi:hypothetical protein